MPKEISHILFADDILQGLGPGRASEIIWAHKSIYYFGSMSPDIFYYDFRLPGSGPRGDRWGGIIHGKDGEDNTLHVQRMLESGRSSENAVDRERYFAFIAGFLTHVAADTNFHPMIYAVSGHYYDPDPLQRKLAMCRHYLFESCMDLHLLGRRGWSLKNFRLLDRLKIPDDFRDPLLRFFSDVLTQAHDPFVDLFPLLKNCLFASRIMQRSFQSVTLFRLMNIFNRLAGGKFDFALSTFYVQSRASAKIKFDSLPDVPHPVSGKKYPGSIFVLAEKTKRRGVDFVKTAFQFYENRISSARMKRVIRPYSLNTGIENCSIKEMKRFQILPGIHSWSG